MDFDGFTADFAIFDVSLGTDREVEDHRNGLTAVGAEEFVFHRKEAYGISGGWTMARRRDVSSSPEAPQEEIF